jgi:NAD(P)-dependent dehydrogenase (short-subunit alcohol dehydrogenase family)
MPGKTVLITGANQGIGKESAVQLASMGARVVIVARDAGKGRAAADEIATRSKSDAIELLIGDLSVVAETRRVAREFREKHDRLDVLLNNAGVLATSRRTTVDGLEHTFATNHMGYFVLTTELLDLLKASAPSRVVSVASRAHLRGTMHWNDLQLERGAEPSPCARAICTGTERGWTAWKAYAQSKLANVLFTRELAKRLEGTRVTANCLHPGVIASGFGKTDGGVFRFLWTLMGPFLSSPADGASTQVWLSASPDVEGISGKYFADRREARPSREARDDEAAKRLWTISEEIANRAR